MTGVFATNVRSITHSGGEEQFAKLPQTRFEVSSPAQQPSKGREQLSLLWVNLDLDLEEQGAGLEHGSGCGVLEDGGLSVTHKHL